MKMRYWLNQNNFDSRKDAMTYFDGLTDGTKEYLICNVLIRLGFDENEDAAETIAHIIALADGTAGRDIVDWALSSMEDIVAEDARGCPEDDWTQGYDGLGVEYKGSEEAGE